MYQIPQRSHHGLSGAWSPNFALASSVIGDMSPPLLINNDMYTSSLVLRPGRHIETRVKSGRLSGFYQVYGTFTQVGVAFYAEDFKRWVEHPRPRRGISYPKPGWPPASCKPPCSHDPSPVPRRLDWGAHVRLSYGTAKSGNRPAVAMQQRQTWSTRCRSSSGEDLPEI